MESKDRERAKHNMRHTRAGGTALESAYGPAMQIIRNRKVYDVAIIGSGAGGGMAAKVLTEAGADCVMLEAGPMWDPVRDSKMFAWNYDSPRRGAAIPQRQFGEFDGALGGWTLDG